MRIPLKILHPTLLSVLLMVAHANAGAEGFLDLYGGAAGSRADVSVSETTSSGTTSAAARIDLSSTAETARGEAAAMTALDVHGRIFRI